MAGGLAQTPDSRPTCVRVPLPPAAIDIVCVSLAVAYFYFLQVIAV